MHYFPPAESTPYQASEVPSFRKVAIQHLNLTHPESFQGLSGFYLLQEQKAGLAEWEGEMHSTPRS